MYSISLPDPGCHLLPNQRSIPQLGELACWTPQPAASMSIQRARSIGSKVWGSPLALG